jgi:hypothetical protein
VVLAASWLGIGTMLNPDCTVDPGHADGVAATQVVSGGMAVLELLVAALVTTSFVQSSEEGWGRVGIALLLPIGALVLWGGYVGLLDAVLEELGAARSTSSCW